MSLFQSLPHTITPPSSFSSSSLSAWVGRGGIQYLQWVQGGGGGGATSSGPSRCAMKKVQVVRGRGSAPPPYSPASWCFSIPCLHGSFLSDHTAAATAAAAGQTDDGTPGWGGGGGSGGWGWGSVRYGSSVVEALGFFPPFHLFNGSSVQF